MWGSDVDSVASDVSRAAEDLDIKALEESQGSPVPKTTAMGKGKGKARKRGGLKEEQKLEIVEFLKEKPHIYNKSTSLYKDAAVRKREWEELADRLGVEVDRVLTWYRSMRTMLARVKKEMKTGQGRDDLSHASKWVFEHLGFMTPHIEMLHKDSLGKKRKLQAESVDSDPESQDDAGPSRKVEKKPAPATATFLPPAPPSSLGSDSRSSVSSAECCGQLRREVQTHLQRAMNHQSQFWGYLQWKTSNFTAHQRAWMEDEVMQVVMNHCAMAEPAIPEPMPGSLTASATTLVVEDAQRD